MASPSCISAASGAAAAPLAALMQDGDAMRGRRVGLVVSGGNIDTPVLASVLAGVTPDVQ
jgi:threonine dehydratase